MNNNKSNSDDLEYFLTNTSAAQNLNHKNTVQVVNEKKPTLQQNRPSSASNNSGQMDFNQGTYLRTAGHHTSRTSALDRKIENLNENDVGVVYSNIDRKQRMSY